MSKHGECMSPQLDLFSTLPVQSAILKTEEVSYKPIASLSNAPVIEFVSLGFGDSLRDLSSTYLRIIFKIKKSPTEDHTAGTPAAGSAAAVPSTGGGVVNTLLHSLFRQITVYLNGVAISMSDTNYHYRAYFETLLNYGVKTKWLLII